MTHHVLPGSFEQDGTNITAAVHVGDSEWVPKELRYIKGDMAEGQEGDTLISFLGRIYDNSTGCLMKGDFAMK